jgi:hypothetical protein
LLHSTGKFKKYKKNNTPKTPYKGLWHLFKGQQGSNEECNPGPLILAYQDLDKPSSSTLVTVRERGHKGKWPESLDGTSSDVTGTGVQEGQLV